MYKALDLCEPISTPYPEYPAAYEVDPAVMYPATAAHIIDVLEGDAPAPPANLAGEMAAARALGAAAFELVGYAPGEVSGEDVDARAKALEICRRFFTEALHSAAGYEKLFLRITKNERFRLRA